MSKELLLQVFYFLFGISFVNGAFYFIFLTKLINMLKEKYPDKFRELGEPSLWWNNSPRNGYRMLRFILSHDPIFSTDKELSTTKNFAYVFLCTGLLIFILLLILFSLFFFTGHQ